ncbi:MAG: hypothetical protein ABIQ70_03695 [Dokdonella sp.]
MRIHLLGGLLAGALMTAATGHAQTWETALPFDSNPYTSSTDSCAVPPQWLYLDDGLFPVYASSVVYHVSQYQLGLIGHPAPPLRPWLVTLYPQSWVDMSLWVCKYKNGSTVGGCVDVDDEYGYGTPEHVTVPARRGSYYIVVTGNVAQQPPLCGQYFLTATHY